MAFAIMSIDKLIGNANSGVIVSIYQNRFCSIKSQFGCEVRQRIPFSEKISIKSL